MNVVDKDATPLIRIGYWEFHDRFGKIAGPLLEFYKGDDADIFFRMIDKKHTSIDTSEPPYSIEDIDISIVLKDGYWPENKNKYEYSEVAGGGIEILNEEGGYFKWRIPKEHTAEIGRGHHLFYVHFEFGNDDKRTIIKDFIEFLE